MYNNTFKVGQQSRQKAVLTSAPRREEKNTPKDRLVLTYKRTDTNDGKVHQARKLIGDYTKQEVDLLRSLEAESSEGRKEFVVVKEFNGQFWNLKEVLPITEWQEREKRPWVPHSERRKGDNPAAKVGGLMHDAAALLGPQTNSTPKEIAAKAAALVRELAKESYIIEAEIAAGKYKPEAAQATTTTPVTTNSTEDFAEGLAYNPQGQHNFDDIDFSDDVYS